MVDTRPDEPAAAPEVPAPVYEIPAGFETKFKDLPLRLDAFEGPLDLLLYLIHQNKLDILNLPIADVTRQYLDYLLLMEELNIEIASEFVAMAAQLIQVKSRMLLPRPPAPDGAEEDPRGELIQRLLDYQAVKEVAKELSGREAEWQHVVFAKGMDLQEHAKVENEPIRCGLFDLLAAYREALKRLLPPPPVEVRAAPKTLEQRLMEVLELLHPGRWEAFGDLLADVRSKDDLVLTFLALLELVRTGRIVLVQTEAFGEIRVKAA